MKHQRPIQSVILIALQLNFEENGNGIEELYFQTHHLRCKLKMSPLQSSSKNINLIPS